VTICKDAIIGNDVFIGPNTTLLNDKYPPTSVSLPPVIEDGAIIGGGVILAPNVRIGKRAVVGAGSVITKDVPSETVIITESKQKTIMTRREYDLKQIELWEQLK
jgi:acetyltransferase-like isoleucine patch superfamily enzyme